MPSGCCVPQCTNQKGGFTFPKDHTIRKAWINSLCRVVIDEQGKKRNWEPADDSRVCEDHFRESDFITKTTKGRKQCASN